MLHKILLLKSILIPCRSKTPHFTGANTLKMSVLIKAIFPMSCINVQQRSAPTPAGKWMMPSVSLSLSYAAVPPIET